MKFTVIRTDGPTDKKPTQKPSPQGEGEWLRHSDEVEVNILKTPTTAYGRASPQGYAYNDSYIKLSLYDL